VLGDLVHRSDGEGTSLTGQSKVEPDALFCGVVCMHSFRGSCIGLGGACTCAGGALCGSRALVWWCVLFSLACFCLGCIKPLPLPKQTKTCLLQVILLVAFPLAFTHLLNFLLVV
jgi:hypothetical protein